MTNTSMFNQYEANRRGSQTAQNILNKSIIAFFEVIKFLFAFIGSMWRQFIGK